MLRKQKKVIEMIYDDSKSKDYLNWKSAAEYLKGLFLMVRVQRLESSALVGSSDPKKEVRIDIGYT